MCQPGLELLLEARDGEDRLVTPQSEHLKVGRRLVRGEETREQLVSAEAAVGERRQFWGAEIAKRDFQKKTVLMFSLKFLVFP